MSAILRSLVLAYVAERKWRGEIGIVNHFSKMERTGPGSWARRFSGPMVEDALFELVVAGKLQWFGAEDPNGHLPLRYRVTKGKS